jgi:hypothetical protein
MWAKALSVLVVDDHALMANLMTCLAKEEPLIGFAQLRRLA